MTEPQASLVVPLGKSSGREVDKRELCRQAGWPWQKKDGVKEEVLPDCITYLELTLKSFHVRHRAVGGESEGVMLLIASCVGVFVWWQDAGDHDVALCELTAVYRPRGSKQLTPLSSDYLRSKGII